MSALIVRSDQWRCFYAWIAVLRLTLATNSRNPSALVAISKGMQAVKLYSDKILQFLTWVAD